MTGVADDGYDDDCGYDDDGYDDGLRGAARDLSTSMATITTATMALPRVAPTA